MIAMFLAAQIAVSLPQGLPLEVIPPPRGHITPRFANGVVRALPSHNCPGGGRLEASFAAPAAIYRRGDRPAKPLLRWTDYPDPQSCLVEIAP